MQHRQLTAQTLSSSLVPGSIYSMIMPLIIGYLQGLGQFPCPGREGAPEDEVLGEDEVWVDHHCQVKAPRC